MTETSVKIPLSFVVTTRERSEGCRRLCAALERQLAGTPSLPAEVVLVFDGCPPYEWFAESALYRVVALKHQIGIARARNAGIASTRGEIVAFLDDDAVPADGWLAALVEGLRSYPEAAAFGGRVVGSDRVNVYAQLRDQVYYRETFGLWYVDPGGVGDLVGPPYVNGGNSAYRRAALTNSDGFDPRLPAYSDVELGRRLSLDRYGVLLAGMTILHDHPSTFRAYMARCHRSGRARALMWSRRRYQRESPGRVAGSVLANLLWRNAVRSRRVTGSQLGAFGVLFLQEVVHVFGYVRSLAG
jgi:GT2 family glycosyltransferase